jgi:hypothetical protein
MHTLATRDVNHHPTHLPDPCQLIIIVQEERQVLVTNIHLRISSKLPMFLQRLPSPGEPMLIDLILDLRWRVRHIDTRIRIRCAHLRLWTLKSGEELGVYEGWFGVSEFLRDVACEPEVGVLIDGAGNETGDVGYVSEDLGERVREGGRRLDRCEMDFANIVSAMNHQGRAQTQSRD